MQCWCAEELTEYSWFKKGTMKEQFSPFLSSNKLFCLTLVFSFFQRRFFQQLWRTKENLLSVPLMKALAVCCHLQATRCWRPTPAEAEEDEGDLWGGAWGCDLTCLLFCSEALTPAECRLTNPLYTEAVFIKKTVTFSCTLNAASVILIKSSCSPAESPLNLPTACPLIVIQWLWHEPFSCHRNLVTLNWTENESVSFLLKPRCNVVLIYMTMMITLLF